ncbi:MAG: MarR family winged helix-turn-helix transcriptional regulator [Janthinobacterium lividum]
MSKPSAPVGATRLATLAVELRVLLGQLRRRLREEARAGDLTPSQISVLTHLKRDGPATVTTLARIEGVRPQSMGATVATLQTAGLVSGAPDPADGRQTLLSLTPACLELIEATRAAREDWLYRAIQTHLSAHEQTQLASSVELLKRLLDS